MKKKITLSEEHELEAFLFAFPLDRWTPDTVFNYYTVNGNQLCKICDNWVKVHQKKRHSESHVERWLEVVDKRREQAKKKRIEALKRSRINKKNNNGT